MGILYVHVKYDFCQREVNCMLKVRGRIVVRGLPYQTKKHYHYYNLLLLSCLLGFFRTRIWFWMGCSLFVFSLFASFFLCLYIVEWWWIRVPWKSAFCGWLVGRLLKSEY